MNITFYHMNGETNQLDKSAYLDSGLSFEGTLREQCSLLTPSVTIDMSTSVGNPLTCNYVYIPSFERYYFVTNIVVINNKLVRFDLDVDVLMSFKNDILNLKDVLIDRQESLFDSEIEDDNVIYASNPEVVSQAPNTPYTSIFTIPSMSGRYQDKDIRVDSDDRIVLIVNASGGIIR